MALPHSDIEKRPGILLWLGLFWEPVANVLFPHQHMNPGGSSEAGVRFKLMTVCYWLSVDWKFYSQYGYSAIPSKHKWEAIHNTGLHQWDAGEEDAH